MSIIDQNNLVLLDGHAGGTAELRRTANDREVANFRIATNPSFSRRDKDTGEWVEFKEQWHNIVAWGPTAAYVHRNLRKGSEVKVTGRLVTREYLRKVELDGSETVEVQAWSTEVHASQISIRNPKRLPRASQGADTAT